MSVNRIYQCLWQLLHYLVSLYEVCLWVRLRVIAFALWSYDLCQTQTKLKKNEFEFLRRCKSQLEKIPKHLNLIIGPEAKDVNEELLTRLFSYALYMNIECISFFDTRSIAVAVTSSRETNKSIDLNKLKCPEGWKSKNINDNRAVWYCIDSELSNGSKSHTNGCVPTSLANNCSKSTNGHLTSDISKTRMKSLEVRF